MPPLNILIKPASNNCNMRCKYCFYADVAANRSIPSFGMMDMNTAENLIKKAFSHKPATSVQFAFQGGEPTLMRVGFYREFVNLVKKHNHQRLQVSYAIQTNGMLVDKEFAEFFAENAFLVGLSLDGTKDINDAYRISASGEGTYKHILQAAQLLSAANVEFNILTVITSQTARSIGKIYGFFKRNNLKYQQYIPCLDPLHQQRGGYDYSLTPELYEYFLKKLFDMWYADIKKGDYIFIRYFENILNVIAGYPPESCGMAGRCHVQHVIEADGTVYPCDFYVLDEYATGSINENSFEEIISSGIAKQFIAQSLQKSEKCNGCKWLNICRGGCRRDREPTCGGALSHNYFCEAFKNFFDYSYDRFVDLLKHPPKISGF